VRTRPLQRRDRVLEQRRDHGKSSATARGLPGNVTISVRPAIPATARLSAPIGCCARASACSAASSPVARRSMTRSAASGVQSSGVKPVPPVVKTSAIPPST
jgi:hypothetical protein